MCPILSRHLGRLMCHPIPLIRFLTHRNLLIPMCHQASRRNRCGSATTVGRGEWRGTMSAASEVTNGGLSASTVWGRNGRPN